MDIKEINEISKKFNILWYESKEYLEMKKKEEIEKNKIKLLLPEFFNTFETNNYTFGYKPLQEIIEKSLFDNYQHKTLNGLKYLELKKGDFIYKGMHDFLRKKESKKLLNMGINKCSPIWYGNIFIAFLYAQRYFGGIESYKLTKNVKFIIFNDKDNIKYMINYIIKYNKQNIINEYKIKTGYNTSMLKQLEYAQKFYNYDNTVYLCKNNVNLDTNEELLVNGLHLWGAGRLDRIVYNVLCNFACSHGFDGFVTKKQWTPYTSKCVNNEEIVLCKPYEVLKRSTSNKYDWYS